MDKQRIKRLPPRFDNQMSKTQIVLGWIYVPVHMFVLPLLLNMLAAYYPGGLDDVTVNILYYAAGVLFTAIVMGGYLRRHFDALLDNLLRSVMALLFGVLIEYSLSLLSAIVLLLVEENVINPNNDAVMELAQTDLGAIKGLAVFIGPVVEEVLFRGVVFGTLQKKNRTAAYIACIVLFSLNHVWAYALAAQDFTLLLYALQYIPATVALCWVYEHSGSIWASIFMHMGMNAISLAVLSML